MHVLTVRQIPDSLYETLSRLAAKNRRSLQQQAIILLERSRWLQPEVSFSGRARMMRERFDGRELGNVVDDVRGERDR